MRIHQYKASDKELWNDFVQKARNATFLFERDFMDYHRDRFEDCSLIFTNDKGVVQGVLPANFNREEKRIDTHGGLTYGGLLTTKDVSVLSVKEMLKETGIRYLDSGATTLRYKPTPYIYRTYPSEEDLYWLFRADAQLVARSVSSTIDLTNRQPFSTLRKRKVKKATAQHLEVVENGLNAWEDYWEILSTVLQEQHGTHPVHTVSEIKKLAQAFPHQIRLFTVQKDSNMLAGCVIFDCGPVIHVQYIASNSAGRECGALDFLFNELITSYQSEGKHYFDFGISTENGGLFLNEGLLFQKEGFGGRAICYDCYDVPLNKLLLL